MKRARRRESTCAVAVAEKGNHGMNGNGIGDHLPASPLIRGSRLAPNTDAPSNHISVKMSSRFLLQLNGILIQKVLFRSE